MVVRQQRRAYTLMEVLLVMAVMIMILAVGYPAIDSYCEGLKVDAAADDVRGAWSEAQAQAVNEGRPYRFAVIPGKGNYRVAPHSDAYWTGGSPPSPDDPDNPPIILEKSLPDGVVFPSGGEAAGQWSTQAVFLPDGTAEDDADITLRLDNSRPISLHLRALTGVVTVQRGEDE
jgi:Tfp pilus assembly protein FimT